MSVRTEHFLKQKQKLAANTETKIFETWKDPRSLMEASFPKLKTNAVTTASPARINVIVQSIPESTIRIVDLTFLSLGISLNLFAVTVIALKPSMRTSANCYVANLLATSLVILSEPLQEVLAWLFDTHIKVNADYVSMVTFDVTILTMAVLSIDVYVGICQPHTPFSRFMHKKSTALRGVMLIWTTCVMTVATELHIYDIFDVIMGHIYAWFTFVFTVLPCIVFLVIDSAILYELSILKATEGSWRYEELGDYLMLINITLCFFFAVMPYRLASAINFIAPKALCCTDSRREILYLLVKSYPVVLPIIYIVTSRGFRKSLKEVICCRNQKPEVQSVIT